MKDTKSLRQISKRYFSANPLAYVCSGVLFCLVSIICVALCLLIEGFGVIIAVVVLPPLLLGCIMTASSSEFYEKASFGNLFRFSARYYSPQFYGCFGGLKSFLKALIVEFSATFLCMIIFGLIFRGMYGSEFTEPLKLFINYFLSVTNDPEYLTGLLEMNNEILVVYSLWVSAVASIFGVATFILSISYCSISAYFRLLLRTDNAMFGRRAVDQTMRNNRRAMFKDHLALNWPLLALTGAGLIGGFLFSVFALKDLTYSLEFSLMFGLALMAIYMPSYFANMAAIFEKYQFTITKGISDSIKKTLEKIQSSVELSEEDKKQIEETLQKLEEEDKELEDADNKKDPQ